MITWIKRNILYFAFIQAVLATVGSIVASEVLKWPPCSLCWYQRVAMFPLILIIPAGILLKDKKLPYYVLPLSIFGFIVAFYQHFLQIRIIPESAAPCSFGVSCLTKYIEFPLGVTFPLVSALAFAFITACMIIFQKSNQKSR